MMLMGGRGKVEATKTTGSHPYDGALGHMAHVAPVLCWKLLREWILKTLLTRRKLVTGLTDIS